MASREILVSLFCLMMPIIITLLLDCFVFHVGIYIRFNLNLSDLYVYSPANILLLKQVYILDKIVN